MQAKFSSALNKFRSFKSKATITNETEYEKVMKTFFFACSTICASCGIAPLGKFAMNDCGKCQEGQTPFKRTEVNF